MKNKIKIIFLIIGIILLIYPMISNCIYKVTQTVAITNYKADIISMNNDEKEEIKNEYREYNKKILENASSDIDLLNIGQILGYIEIPKINIELTIYEGTSNDVLSNGVGHLKKTTLIGENNTNCCLAGHSGLARMKIFDDLEKLEVEDFFYITMLDETFAYKVDQIKIVEPENTEDLKVVKGKEYVTLITCTPKYINSQRLIVRGVRVKNIESDYEIKETIENKEDIKEKIEFDFMNFHMCILSSVTIIYVIIVVMYFFIIKIKGKHNEK